MVLYAISNLNKKYKLMLTILAGGNKESPNEMYYLQKIIKKLNLKNVVILPTQKNVDKFYKKFDFCFLASVSEGSSYGIKEAINYEIPIITVDIPSNNEITNNMLPTIKFEKHKEYIDNIFCINNYDNILMNLGYSSLSETCEKCSHIFNTLNLASGKYLSVYSPEILFENYKKIKSFLCSNCKKIIDGKNEVFTINVNNIVNAFEEMIDNFENYKQKVVELKKIITPKYFSKKHFNSQLISIFSEGFECIS
jgi:glycosyltransferase involved in cell wall biosynthesis